MQEGSDADSLGCMQISIWMTLYASEAQHSIDVGQLVELEGTPELFNIKEQYISNPNFESYTQKHCTKRYFEVRACMFRHTSPAALFMLLHKRQNDERRTLLEPGCMPSCKMRTLLHVAAMR